MMKQKTKNILLVAGFVLLGIISYQFSISKTLQLRKDINFLELKATSQANTSQTLLSLKSREIFTDSILAKNNLKNSSVQNTLLDLLNQHSINDNIQITSFLEPHNADNNDISETSFRFTLKGSYKTIESVLYELEQSMNLGSVTHLKFSKKRDYGKGIDYLECDVILRGFI